MRRTSARLPILLAATTLMLAACGGGGGGGGDGNPDAVAQPTGPEEKRAQDSRNAFAPLDPAATTFAALAAAPGDVVDNGTTSRWAGVLGGAAYRVEVPANWNGKLVMYAHGYVGTENGLVVGNPSIRRYLIQNGYAWAASSYSKNYYDVRAGVEDTNALALEFNRIAAARARPLVPPSRIYITGHSMGGHISAAAIEAETFATANNKVRYHGAAPMCGVLGDTELFDYFAGAQIAAQTLAGFPAHPFTGWNEIAARVTATLFTTFPSALTPTGEKYASVIQNLTGGERPLFAAGLAQGGSFRAVWGVFGGDGTVNGILNKSVVDTNRFIYTIDGDPAGTASLNAAAQRLTAAPDANRLRSDGLRWIPKTNGEFSIPVVSLHTLGDLYVPFSMQQIYRKRAAAQGSDRWLVQRAIRGISHCDFTVAEQAEAFDAMVRWERDGVKPAGDDVLTPAAVRNAAYGCTFTRNAIGQDDSETVKALRPSVAQSAPCPA